MIELDLARYEPPSMELWAGRKDSPANTCIFQRITPLNLHTLSKINQNSFALVGFCCDEGIKRNLGRIGAAKGPNAIRINLARLPFQRENIVCYDAGNITCEDGNLEAAQQALAQVVAHLLAHQITPIILGGGHEVAWGHYQGLQQVVAKDIKIVNFDAHLDMRPLPHENFGTSGTPFLQIAEACKKNKMTFNYYCLGLQESGNTKILFETAKQHHVNLLMAETFYFGNQSKIDAIIDSILQTSSPIYLSTCLDVFATAFAPGVSAPQILGLLPWHIIPLIRKLAASGKVISYDIAELSPPYDVDERTAKLAASIISTIFHYHSQETHEKNKSP